MVPHGRCGSTLVDVCVCMYIDKGGDVMDMSAAIACVRTCMDRGMTVDAAIRVAYSMLIKQGVYSIGKEQIRAVHAVLYTQ